MKPKHKHSSYFNDDKDWPGFFSLLPNTNAWTLLTQNGLFTTVKEPKKAYDRIVLSPSLKTKVKSPWVYDYNEDFSLKNIKTQGQKFGIWKKRKN